MTPLHIAVLRNKLDLVKLILDYYPPVNRVDSKGKTALDYALMMGNETVMRYLLAAGASPWIVGTS